MPSQLTPRQPQGYNSSSHAAGKLTMRHLASSCEESLVADIRAHRTPAQEVEQRLVGMLRGKFIPVSQVRSASLLRGRFNSGSSKSES